MGSGWLHVPELTASTWAQLQTGSAHAPPCLYMEKHKVKPKADEAGGDEAVPQHSTLSNQELAVQPLGPLWLAAMAQ